MTAQISSIDPDNVHQYEDPLFLTFDIDWACDGVLTDTIDLVEAADGAATWFVTHDTPLLERLRRNPRFELGIHPNFNFLLNGDTRNGRTAEEVVDRLLAVVPEARSIRSHSMTQSSHILQACAARGLTHDCNHFIPEQSGIELRPWRHWNGLVKVPVFWEDDVVCLSPTNSAIEALRRRAGLRVFSFHPIHVFLNTEDLGRYERTRPVHRDPTALLAHRHAGNGARTALQSMLKVA